ncbi:MAG: DUF3611 family protein, partial [Leptolyngbyaceae cyanobacterium CRU_2_3]|nr:DUF3611 family protein [Leptolyngbyaceae cyanobacterium CRU_2_3]
MENRSESYSIPPAVKRVASSFRLVGWISFWVQIVLAIVSGIVLLFAASGLGVAATVAPATPGAVPQTGISSPETGIGLLFAVIGLLALFAGAFWAFRYTRLA